MEQPKERLIPERFIPDTDSRVETIEGKDDLISNLTHCPDCNFAPTEPIEVDQVGTMISTPPITYFATALFQHMAP